MAKQMKKSERILIDRGNKFDPGNNHSDRDYNRKGHKQIHEGIINAYCSCGNVNCELNYQQKILRLNIDPPDCFKICKYKIGIHGCGPDGTYPVAEFMTKWMKNDSNEIYIKRADAFFNYYYKLPFIFRPSWQNGYHLHHWKFPLFDSPEFTAMIKGSENTKIGRLVKPLEKKIMEIERVIVLDSSKFYIYQSEISRIKNEIEKISRRDTDEDFWRLIDKTFTEISNIKEI